MDEFEMRRIIYDYVKEICHLSQMQLFATSSYQKNYFQLQIDETASGLINFFLMNSGSIDQLRAEQQLQSSVKQLNQQLKLKEQQLQPVQQPDQQLQPETREITKEELAQNDGSEGKPAYVAVNQNVYDMTMVIQWAGGTHFGLYAGHDLSNEFMGCHKGMAEILQKLPKVGALKQ